MGCCGSVDIPTEIIPDPVAPSTFFLKKVGVFSANYKVLQGSLDGKLWLLLRRHGRFYESSAYFVLENFVRGGGPNKDDGQALAVARCEKTPECRQYGWRERFDSDFSEGYSDDSYSDYEEQYKQKTKWRFKTYCTFYQDREFSRPLYQLVAKGKGRARRDVTFDTRYDDQQGREITVANVSQRLKLKRIIYHLTPVGSDIEIPIALIGSINRSSTQLVWESPLFRVDVSDRGFTEKPIVTTREGNPAVNLLIGFIVSMELAPEEIKEKVILTWPTVYGPNGVSA